MYVVVILMKDFYSTANLISNVRIPVGESGQSFGNLLPDVQLKTHLFACGGSR